MSSRKKGKLSKEDLVNEPKVVPLPGQTYSYGQTPAALCRQHFEEIAKRLNVTVEELGKDVLNQSLGDQLCMLRDFYKNQNPETEAVYEPLVELCSKEETTPKSAEKVQTKKRKTESTKKVPVARKVSRVLVLSSESESEDDKIEKPIVKSPKVPVKKALSRKNTTTSRIQLSIEETIAGSIEEAVKNIPETKIDKEPLENTDKLESASGSLQENPNKQIEVAETANELQPILPVPEPVRIETTVPAKEPVAVFVEPDKPANKELEDDDLETFLYGKSPTKPKAPPKKKHQRFPSQSMNDRKTESPPPSEFSIPGLTFESKSWSPSRQRDLLSVARDVAALQKSIASGEKPNDSVSEKISFTKQSN